MIDLTSCPLIQSNGFDFRNMYTDGTMYATAFQAHKAPQVCRSPTWVPLTTVATSPVVIICAHNLCQFLVKLRARVHNFDVCEFCPSVWRSNPLSKLQAHSHSQSPRPSKQVYRSSKKKKMSKLLITVLSSSSIKMVLISIIYSSLWSWRQKRLFVVGRIICILVLKYEWVNIIS